MSDTLVTTHVSGAKFQDGSTLSGSWTAEYDSTGKLVAVSNATFVVSGSGGTTTFTQAGTLPYANSPSNTSYEIHFLAAPSGGSYGSLYVDWKSESPSSLYEGSSSLYTSVINPNSSTPATPLRLVSDGTTGVGSLPSISGLPSAQTATDATAFAPFSTVTVTDPDSTTTTSATISLSYNGTLTDADGILSGTGLTKAGTGIYTLAYTSPANLTAELRSLKFTPTLKQTSAGNSIATSINLSVNDSDGTASAATMATVTATCFLRGTMIETPAGETAVESLRAGDLVSTIENGMRVMRPVAWIGSGSMNAANLAYCDEAFPVRIRKDAFAAGIPHRDLLVTPEHCILTEAGLTPARMLVNNRSILIDHSLPAYDFFHVELEHHAILLSEGLATESYLDTGNRDLFIDEGATVSVRQDVAMAAPLAVARTLVEPIWTRLADRARALGFEGSDNIVALTDQPDLRLLLDDGRELPACWHNSQRHLFRIPSKSRPVRLLSRAAIPAHVIGPFVDDRRTLGVAVGKLALWSGLNETLVPLADLALGGWHAAEDTHRWTDGKAELDLPEAGPETFLEVHLTATALYPESLAA